MMSFMRRARRFFTRPASAADLVGSPFTPRSGDDQVLVSVFGEVIKFDQQVLCDGFSIGDQLLIPVCVATTFNLGAEIDVTVVAPGVRFVYREGSSALPVKASQLDADCNRATISAGATSAGTAILMTWEISWQGQIDVEISVTVRGQKWRFDNTLFCDQYGVAKQRDIYQCISKNSIILLKKAQAGFGLTRLNSATEKPSNLRPVDVEARVEYATTQEIGSASKPSQLRELTLDEVAR